MTHAREPWRVAVAEGDVPVAVDRDASSTGRTVFVCAHGAGGNMDDGALRSISAVLRPLDITVVRFNFPYRERKSSRPDPMPRLMACVSAVADRVRQELAPARLILGGRSMGGRAASMLAADGYACDGLLLLAYPLHPPGQPEKLRAAHLSRITVPVICFNGTRDAFCQRDLMERAVGPLAPRWTMRWLEGADHGFHVLKSSGTTDAAILETIARETEAWTARALRA